MAIYHCSIKIISRGKGKSAIAASAYRSGEKIINEYDGIIHDYTKKGGIVYKEIMLPNRAPAELINRSVLWNSVEKIEKSKNAQLAREIEVALPVELNREQQIQLVKEYVKKNFVSCGMCADFAIHDKKDGNPHAHIMLTMRPLEKSGEWGAKSKKEYILDKNNQKIILKNGNYKSRKVDTVDWNNKEKAEVWREAWADCINRSLEKQKIQRKVDHRSYERQGIEQVPTIHIGVSATQMEQRGIPTEKCERNRQIITYNKRLKKIKNKLYKLKIWIKELMIQKEDFLNTASKPLTINEKLGIAKKIIEQQDNSDENKSVIYFDEKVVNFLQEKNITSLSDLQKEIAEMQKQCWKTAMQDKQIEKLLKEKKNLVKYTEDYLKYKGYHTEYKEAEPKKQASFMKRYRNELALYNQAEKYLVEHLGKKATLKPIAWKNEIAVLMNEHNSLEQKVRKLQEDTSKMENVKKYIEQTKEQIKKFDRTL